MTITLSKSECLPLFQTFHLVKTVLFVRYKSITFICWTLHYVKINSPQKILDLILNSVKLMEFQNSIEFSNTSWKISKSFLNPWKSLSGDPCHTLVAKGKKGSKHLLSLSPDFKVVSLQACWKTHWCSGKGVQKSEFSS